MTMTVEIFSIQTAQYRDAKCIGMNPEIFFMGEDKEIVELSTLVAICNGCPCFTACRKDADEHGDSGFRAGTTHKQRVRQRNRETGRRIQGKKGQTSVTESRIPRVMELRGQGLSNTLIAQSMNLKVHSIDRVIRIIKDREAA